MRPLIATSLSRTAWLLATALLVSCTGPAPQETAPASAAERPDPHSFSRPDQIAVTHLDLDLEVDFAARQLHGRASLQLAHKTASSHLYLDSRDLEILRVTRGPGEAEAPFTLGEKVPYLGRELAVEVTSETEWVTVEYATSPDAAALLWMESEQTASGKPFLFTQSEAILARTWVPIQDSPGVRFTYEATVTVPAGLLALMSAENPVELAADGRYYHQMAQPVPAYLLALAVGDLEMRPLGQRAGVYAEPQVVDKAAWELADTEAMIEAAEALYGPYRWGRYDVLILPSSFPFGGMENPRLTFATPTILAGDRSLVSLIAHELAHSWSGNLVTNATWDEFWLNEGFTTYFERRIMEALYGRPYSEMLATLGLQDLEGLVGELGAENPDTRLHLDLAGRDPDDGMSDIAYEKGYAFLRRLEELVGRERWDAFLRGYFDRFAFHSMDTATFLTQLRENLLSPEEQGSLDLDAWAYGEGLPEDVPRPQSDAFSKVEDQLQAWLDGTPAARLDTGVWTTHEWLHFLRQLPEELSAEQLEELDSTFGLNASGNSEILFAWLLQAVHHGYEPAQPALEGFLTSMGRRKFLLPLYRALAQTPGGRERALEIYRRARPAYHAVAQVTVDDLLDWHP